METTWMCLMDKRGEKAGLENVCGACNRGQSPCACGPQRKPQAASAIVEVRVPSEPNIIYKQAFW